MAVSAHKAFRAIHTIKPIKPIKYGVLIGSNGRVLKMMTKHEANYYIKHHDADAVYMTEAEAKKNGFID